jgi:ketosteroid isomerase-like protein
MTSTEKRNMELMQTLDDAWNAQDLETFAKCHKTDTIVRWPGQSATHGVEAHKREALDFFRAFPNQHLDNRPYKVLIASGDWTCSIARFTGTMTGPMKGSDGKEIAPTGKSFDWIFAQSRNGIMAKSWRKTSFMISSRLSGKSESRKPFKLQ